MTILDLIRNNQTSPVNNGIISTSRKVTLNPRGRGGACCREWLCVNILAIAENRRITKGIARIQRQQR